VKNVLRILAFTAVALGLFYAPAAKAETFTLTAAGSLVGNSATTISINLTLTGTPLSNGKAPNYGITSATGSVIVAGEPTFTNIALVAGSGTAPGGEISSGVWSAGTLTYDNKLLGVNAANYLNTEGLLLVIPGLTETKNVTEVGQPKKVAATSDYWVLEWNKTGGYYELQNTLVTAAYYNLGNSVEVPSLSKTPEPITLVLFGTGLIGIGGMVRRKLSR
jgi:hypothetical protein